MTLKTTIRMLSQDEAEATREAASLRKSLLDEAPSGVNIEIIKEDKYTQDLGATLVLLCGAPAVVAVAQAIADWIRKRRIGSSVDLEINGVRIKLTGEIADNPERIEVLIRASQNKT